RYTSMNWIIDRRMSGRRWSSVSSSIHTLFATAVEYENGGVGGEEGGEKRGGVSRSAGGGRAGWGGGGGGLAVGGGRARGGGCGELFPDFDDGVHAGLDVVAGRLHRQQLIAVGERHDQVHLRAVADLREALALVDALALPGRERRDAVHVVVGDLQDGVAA